MDYFLEYLFCCQFATSDEIKDLLEDLATKKKRCPLNARLTRYTDNYHKLYTDVLKHFKLKDTIDLNNNIEIKNWSSIRKKTTKDLILKNFIIKVKYKYKFDDATTSKFKRDLMIGLNFKNINDKNIVIKDNNIDLILGLNLSINSYSWDYDIFAFG